MPARRVSCKSCNRGFIDATALAQHEKTTSQHGNSCCGKRFASRKKLVAHNIRCHWYCATCDRFFNSPSNLQSHISSIHRAKTIRCLGGGCKRIFISVSAMTQHLESGACRSNVTRAIVNHIAIRLDGNNVITNPSRLIQGPEGYRAPVSTPPPIADASSWNGRSYGCFSCNNEFRLLAGLNQHLRSPIHDIAIYRCPNKDGCSRVFTTLSGLCQHVERNKCGVQRLKYAKLAIESLMVGMRRIEYR